MAGADEPWSVLVPGDRFVVTSLRGDVYEPTFIRNGPPGVGLYVRHNGALGRLHLDHFDWKTFQRLLPADILARGDQVLFEVRRDGAPTETRGTFVELAPAGVVVTVDSPDKPVTFPLREIMSGSFRLLLTTKRLRAGEEFSGFTQDRTYLRGFVRAGEDGNLAVDPPDGGPPISLRPDDLNLYSVNVLIPVPLSVADDSLY